MLYLEIIEENMTVSPYALKVCPISQESQVKSADSNLHRRLFLFLSVVSLLAIVF